ncbi:hypothetical protein BpHYR1_044357 [Brachionus plicatilis]|uniref:Uncharacterized protein n=1 Tax=Brachionus plicatilis TaxID=10195 RepID=A0A3M7SSM9_BRAPC|nr:hypothetical protein BpHYR1_044357 [Brachionus plicatilis]
MSKCFIKEINVSITDFEHRNSIICNEKLFGLIYNRIDLGYIFKRYKRRSLFQEIRKTRKTRCQKIRKQEECQWRFLKLYIIEFTYNRITYNRISTKHQKGSTHSTHFAPQTLKSLTYVLIVYKKNLSFKKFSFLKNGKRFEIIKIETDQNMIIEVASVPKKRGRKPKPKNQEIYCFVR